jgi:hypothetical protein
MADKLVINVLSDAVDALGDHYPGYEATYEADMTHQSVHSWLKIFEKVLLAQGFSSHVIQKGCMELAFNDWRSKESMQKLYDEYDLQEFAPTDKL